MEVFKGVSLTIEFYKINSLLKTIRTDAEITEEIYKEEVLVWMDKLNKYQPDNVYVDGRKLKLIITPDLQNWVDGTLMKTAIDNSIKKVAYIISPDLFTQVSVEQAFDMEEGKKLNFHYFTTSEDAEKWINE